MLGRRLHIDVRCSNDSWIKPCGEPVMRPKMRIFVFNLPYQHSGTAFAKLQISQTYLPVNMCYFHNVNDNKIVQSNFVPYPCHCGGVGREF